MTTTTTRKVFYTLCFSVWFTTQVRVSDNLEEYINDLKDLSEAIPAGAIDTFKLQANSEEEALEKAKKYYSQNGWQID